MTNALKGRMPWSVFKDPRSIVPDSKVALLKVMLRTLLCPASITVPPLTVPVLSPSMQELMFAFAFPMFLTVRYSESFWTTGDPTIIRTLWFAAAAPVENIQLTTMPVTARAATVIRIVIIGVDISPLLLLFLGVDIFPRKTWAL